MKDEDMPRPVTISDEKILSEFSNSDGPVATAPDLADRLPLTRDAIRRRLDKMEEDGRIQSRVVGANAKVWFPRND
jgi:predicted ArsR family transcriptional regulator